MAKFLFCVSVPISRKPQISLTTKMYSSNLLNIRMSILLNEELKDLGHSETTLARLPLRGHPNEMSIYEQARQTRFQESVV